MPAPPANVTTAAFVGRHATVDACRVRVAPAGAGPSRGRLEVAHEDKPLQWQAGGSASTVDRERGPEHAGATRTLPPPPRHAQSAALEMQPKVCNGPQPDADAQASAPW
jgi:hypothetical protein